MIEHLNYSYMYANKYDEDIFINYVLNPRINIEPLTPYCKFINNYYDDNMKDKFVENP